MSALRGGGVASMTSRPKVYRRGGAAATPWADFVGFDADQQVAGAEKAESSPASPQTSRCRRRMVGVEGSSPALPWRKSTPRAAGEAVVAALAEELVVAALSDEPSADAPP